VATTKGTIKAISISKHKGTIKTNVPSAELIMNKGIENDAHAGSRYRQVSLLPVESIDEVLHKGIKAAPGDFAENITTEGIELYSLRLNSILRLGSEAEIQITQLGKKCHNKCRIFQQLGDCIMPREGIFAKVIRGGKIRIGDVIEVLNHNDKICNTDNK